MNTKLIETIIESNDFCEKNNVDCANCKFKKCCYTDIDRKDIVYLLKEVYQEVKVNTDWS